jgi:hypothetical protein
MVMSVGYAQVGGGGLTYSYANNNQSFGGQEYLIERHMVQVSLAQAL